MKKLKSTLLFKIILLLLISFIYIFIYDKFNKSSFNNEHIIYGYITKYIVNDNNILIYLNSKEKILCRYKSNNFNYELGDYIKVEGNLELPKNNTIFNNFNYKNYLKYEHINYIFNTNNIMLIKKNNNLLYKIKNMILKRIENSTNKNYLYTFILGNTKYIDDDVINSYRNNGISHLFAVSGMHVSLLSLLILKLFNKVKFKNIILVFFVIFYMFLTDFSPSIMRTGIFLILLLINKKFKLNIDNKFLMIILLCICILIDPYVIFKIGFQYSYLISLTLIYFSDIIKKQKNYFCKLLLISFISFLVSIPITVNNFFQINFLGIILNLFFVPFVSFILFPITLITFIIPINITFLINIFENISIFLSKINIFILVLPKLNIPCVIAYYIIIFIVLLIYKNNKIKSLILFLLLIVTHISLPYFNFNTEISFFDVSQGDSALIKIKNNRLNILIDTGGLYGNSYLSENIVNYFKSIGIHKLDYLILSHGDYDHMGEAINLVNNFKVEKVIFNCGPYNDLEKELIKILDKKHIKYYSCIKELDIDKNKLYFLQTKEYDNENDSSSVIYTEINGYKFMLMGDAGVDKEKDILDKYNITNIDVLKVGHHGSKTSSSHVFINEMNPKYSIISVGKNNRYGHPNKEVLENLKESKIYRTDQDGSIMFKIKNNQLKIETCSS